MKTYLPKLPKTNEANSMLERVDKHGKVQERRFYDDKGRAYIDIDLCDHRFPEQHPWEINGEKMHAHTYQYTNARIKRRSEARALTMEEYELYVAPYNIYKEKEVCCNG